MKPKDASRENRKRANFRSAWLDRQREKMGWTSDSEICINGGPSYNTIALYRRGIVTTRLAYVRRKLATAFGCDISEVPY